MPGNGNIILTGFMGTGKTTAGKALAARLDRRFQDMDDLIEEGAGLTVPEIFTIHGEARFRDIESQVCRDVAAQSDLIVATGGGALVNPENHRVLAESGTVICLSATPEQILERIRNETHRPLLDLAPDNRLERIRALLTEREERYSSIPLQIDTTDFTVDQIVDHILTLVSGGTGAGARSPRPAVPDAVGSLQVLAVRNPDGSYPIWTGSGALAATGALLHECGLEGVKVAILSNPDVEALHAAGLVDALRADGFDLQVFTMPEGEQYKTLETVRGLYSDLLAAGMDRRSPVLALGGGVVTDTAGFVAATYLRGVPYVVVPTTLLAMVDSSVGAKCGVDLPEGKNLIGAFKQPVGVLLDPDLLDTLPPPELRAGMAEVAKHAILGDAHLFDVLMQAPATPAADWLAAAVQVKIDVVEEDPLEQGRRAILNFGHTFAHALEQVSQYAIRHGEAVAVGMMAATHLSVQAGLCSPSTAQRIRSLLTGLELPVRVHDIDSAPDLSGRAGDLLAAMGTDKKRRGAVLRFVVIEDLQQLAVIPNPGDELVRAAWEHVLN